MRTLTIYREKTFVGCIMPVYLYITDEFDGDIKINGEKCRLLGKIGNGQTKNFMISGRKAVLYAACGKGDLYPDRLELPCSEKNIMLSGKCNLGPKKGNPFHFHRPSLSAEKIEAVIKTAGLIACGDKEVIYAARDMVDILIRCNYAIERDYKDEKEDFAYFFSSLNNTKQNGLTVNSDIIVDS